MTLPLANLTAWCLQVAVVIGAGAAVPWLFRLTSPKARLVYWQMLLVTCIVLPLLQPRHAKPVLTTSDVSIVTGNVQPVSDRQTSGLKLTAEESVAAVLAGGAFIRLLWLCAGLLKLRRLRRSGEALLPLPDEARRMTQRLGVTADFYVSPEVRSPVTFGARSPVILLPTGFLELSVEKREPVICHELLHIQRNDWLFAIGEELVRCALWFHPALWWLLGRIQLTREQVVDRTVIEYTNAAGEYVDALIAIASTRLDADLAPAPLFLKKRHLHQRVTSIVKVVNMSKRRLMLSTFAAFSALPLVVGVAAWQFPLNAAPQEVQDVEVRTGTYRVLHRTGVAYPQDAREKGIGGTVVLSVSVNAKGDVSDAKVISGPEELRKTALSSVLNWHFVTDAKSQPFDVMLFFNAGPAPVAAAKGVAQQPTDSTMAQEIPLTLDTIDMSQLPAALQERIRALNLPRPGDRLMNDRVRQMMLDIRSIDEHVTSTFSARADRLSIQLGIAGANRAVVSPAKPESLASERLRVGGNVMATHLITKVPPSYPPAAKQARIQGTVRINAFIGKDGHILELQLVSGHPLFVPPTIEAVKQWVYEPTLLNGNAVEVMTTIDVNFTLSDGPPLPPPPPQQ